MHACTCTLRFLHEVNTETRLIVISGQVLYMHVHVHVSCQKSCMYMCKGTFVCSMKKFTERFLCKMDLSFEGPKSFNNVQCNVHACLWTVLSIL